MNETTNEDSGGNPMIKTLNPTASAIAAALSSNVALQDEIKQRISQVQLLKVQNRLNAAEVIASLSYFLNANPEYPSFSIVDKNVRDSQRKDISISNDTTTKDDCKNEGSSVDINTVSNPSKDNQFLGFNPNRRWSRLFFVDKDGTAPDLSSLTANADGDIQGNDERTTIYRGIVLAWTKGEIIDLLKSFDETRQKWISMEKKDHTQEDNSVLDLWDNETFFNEVASNLRGSIQRSAKDCKVALYTYADPMIIKEKFSKPESLFILKMVRELSNDEKGRSVDWYKMASELNVKFYQHLSKRRTPWQCFKHYRSNLQSDTSRCPPWNPDEDELLLKYIAAQGPQYLFGGDAVAHTCQHLFPDKDTKQLYHRVHNTLLNPNYIQDRWNTDEQRKLALLMRAYSDEVHPIRHASGSGHFPHRAQIRVTGKWSRSLNPEVSYRPFTIAEDKELLAAAKEYGFDGSSRMSASITKKFPHRTHENLWLRWTEIAEKHEIASSCGNRLIKKSFARKGILGRGADALLSPEDFVIRRKKLKAN